MEHWNDGRMGSRDKAHGAGRRAQGARSRPKPLQIESSKNQVFAFSVSNFHFEICAL
jgi:hypothetical protein